MNRKVGRASRPPPSAKPTADSLSRSRLRACWAGETPALLSPRRGSWSPAVACRLQTDGAFFCVAMKKYWHVINIGIQNTLVYRMNFLFRSAFALIPLFATISLWRAIYTGKEGDIAGYTLAQMVSYYLVVTIVDSLTAVTEDDWQIAADIKDGNISQF